MKIAIITVNFVGSSSSLAEAFLSCGHDVDFYNVVFTSQHNIEFESLTLPYIPHGLGLHELTEFDTDGLKRFKQYSNHLHFFNAICLGYPKNKGITTQVKGYVSGLFQRFVFRAFRNKEYELVNVIGQSSFAVSLSLLFKKWNLPVCHSFHEVLSNHLKGKQLYSGVDAIIEKGIKINLFSEKSALDLKNHVCLSSKQLSVIPFGLFTGFQEYSVVDVLEIADIKDYVLFYGYIEKYKGLDVLYEASKKLNNSDIKIVVAGRGYQPVLESMRSDGRFILINRWLGNSELITLICKSKFIVCPYLSASQSGIPQTVFNFGKPIVATDIESFQEVIVQNANGLIVESNNINELAGAINRMYLDEELYNKMVSNIKLYRTSTAKDEWAKIVSKYIDLVY